MIFKSHMISMLVFALIVSIVLASIRHNEGRAILRYGLKLFLTMAGGVIAFSWLMHVI
ncbi:MAG: hypothetical protein MUF02_07665 [Acidobacteria bacterium]|nr:hypothetical protein [Acidobacteriota bacterium]